jgi:hypothetical protein
MLKKKAFLKFYGGLASETQYNLSKEVKIGQLSLEDNLP